MKRIRLIINADDLGISKSANEAIEQAIQNKCISSSTIIVNGPAFEDAVRIAQSYPQISFGIHLNVDEFKPLTDDGVFRKYKIVDENGCFKKEVLPQFDVIEKDLIEAIYEEWRAQINKLINAGIVPSHVDSHEHTHGITQLQPVFIKFTKEYGVMSVRRQPYTSILEMVVERGISIGRVLEPGTRVQNNSTQVKNKHSFIYRRLRQLWDGHKHRQWIRKMRKEGYAMTDFFDSYRRFCYCFPKLLKYKKMKVLELMTHPGHNGYLDETEMMMRKELQNICQYELINYNQLKR